MILSKAEELPSKGFLQSIGPYPPEIAYFQSVPLDEYDRWMPEPSPPSCFNNGTSNLAHQGSVQAAGSDVFMKNNTGLDVYYSTDFRPSSINSRLNDFGFPDGPTLSSTPSAGVSEVGADDSSAISFHVSPSCKSPGSFSEFLQSPSPGTLILKNDHEEDGSIEQQRQHNTPHSSSPRKRTNHFDQETASLHHVKVKQERDARSIATQAPGAKACLNTRGNDSPLNKRLPDLSVVEVNSIERLKEPFDLVAGERSHKANMLEPQPQVRSAPRYMPTRDEDKADREKHRSMRDLFLVQSKLAGMPYREIREQGNFLEAESTLRGRYRTLTKQPSQRVKKPEWAIEDVRLLEEAVMLLAREPRGFKLAKDKRDTPTISWKQVAAYIANHGGSYHFGNGTCKKKWDELRSEDVVTDLDR
ncbi:MAG: hypothetical protein M1819_004886 [Sarea resinae]|nr:MAG: hypothetical protein M1819_004886 [Sarea resinae]